MTKVGVLLDSIGGIREVKGGCSVDNNARYECVIRCRRDPSNIDSRNMDESVMDTVAIKKKKKKEKEDEENESVLSLFSPTEKSESEQCGEIFYGFSAEIGIDELSKFVLYDGHNKVAVGEIIRHRR